MNCPRCSKPTFKKHIETTETTEINFYYCSTCHYETHPLTIFNSNIEKKHSLYMEELRE